jgi:ribose 5-phosphate isomerase B
MLYIAADHQGFEVKAQIKSFLENAGIKYQDLGAKTYQHDDDFPDYAFELGEAVARDNAMGILICGSGAGMCVAANKVRGIRASEAKNVEMARLGRNDDNFNVLVIDKLTFRPEQTYPIIETFLNTPFSGEERYNRRINKIKAYESR